MRGIMRGNKTRAEKIILDVWCTHLKKKNCLEYLDKANKSTLLLKWRTCTPTHTDVRIFQWESSGDRTVDSVSFCKSNHVSQPHRENIKEKKWFCCYQLIVQFIERTFLSLPHPPFLVVSPTPTNHWTVWGRDFLLVCVIGSSQCVPSPVQADSRPKAVCLDTGLHCRLWASTNLTGRFLLTFPHGYMHIWVEFILPLLFVMPTFTYDPQPQLLLNVFFFLTLGYWAKKDMSPDERKTGLFALIFNRQILIVKVWISCKSQCLLPPPNPRSLPDHLYTRGSSADSGQLWKQLEEEDRKKHLRGDNCWGNMWYDD